MRGRTGESRWELEDGKKESDSGREIGKIAGEKEEKVKQGRGRGGEDRQKWERKLKMGRGKTKGEK